MLYTQALSLGGAIIFGYTKGFLGSLGGYIPGQLVATLLLVAHVFQEFPYTEHISLAFLRYGWTYGNLLLLGLLLMAGIWIDNVLYWFAPGSVVIARFYRGNPAYDSMKLIAYLTTIPAAALFLATVETNFFRHHRAFFRHVIGTGSLADIRRSKRGMVEAARAGLATIVRTQLIVVGAVMIFACDIVGYLGFSEGRASLLRVDVAAANGQFTFLLLVILLLYLDERRLSVAVTTLFVVCNAAFTVGTIFLGGNFTGYGLLFAAALAGLAAALLLAHRLRHLEFRTFMLQPLE